MPESTMDHEEDSRIEMTKMFLDLSEGIRTRGWTPVKEDEIIDAAALLLDSLEMPPISQAIAVGPACSHLLALLAERNWWRERAMRLDGTWPTGS